MAKSHAKAYELVADGRFQRFTLNRLNQFLLEFPISEAGKDYIDRAYLAPSRNVQGGTQNMVSDIPCPKMSAAMPSESYSVEFKFCLAHIFNSQILGYLMQPPPIELRYRGRNDKKVRSLYTPDCALFDWASGLYLEEYKSASDRSSLLDKHPGKYAQSSEGVIFSPPALDLISPWGFKFRVRFDDEIHPVGHANRIFLLNYLATDQAFEWKYIKDEVLPKLSRSGYQTYDELVDAGVDRDHLNWAIANGYLHFDFDASLLDRETDQVNIFPSRVLLEAWSHAVRPNGTRPSAREVRKEELSPGSRIVFDGHPLTVSVVGVSALHAFDENGHAVTLKYDQVNQARMAGTLVLPSDISEISPLGPLWEASPGDLQRAIHKLEILAAIENDIRLPTEEQYSAATIRRWRQAIADGESKGLSAIESLIDSQSNRGFHGPHISLEHDSILNLWIEKRLGDSICPTIDSLYEESKTVSAEHGFSPIGRSSFYERVTKIRSVKTIRKSAGHKNAYQLTPTYWLLEINTPMHGIRAMEVVHIDSTMLDVETSSSISGDATPRAWLTLAMCANSRRVVGMYLSFSPPSHVSSLMVLADIVRRMGRLPDSIIHDWGSEFKAKCLWEALSALRILHHIRPKSAPRFGAALERMFGITTTQLFANIMGNTKLRKRVRTITPLVDPSRFNGLWLVDLYEALQEYFFEIYDTTKHSATGFQPRIAYDRSILVHGNRIHRCRSLDSILPIILPPPRSTKGNQVDPARGIFVNGRHYGHPRLANLTLKGTRPPIRVIPFDPGSILAFLDKKWIVCKSSLSARVSRLSHHVSACLFEELRLERIIARQSKSRDRILALCKSLNEKALRNIEYWEDAEAQSLLDISDQEEAGSELTHSSAFEKLQRMFQKSIARHLENEA